MTWVAAGPPMKSLRGSPRALSVAAVFWIGFAASAAEIPEPTFSVADVSVFEGTSGLAALAFVISRSHGIGRSSVSYAVSDGTALAGSDYVAVPNGGFLFSNGDTRKTVTISVRGDTIGELDETLRITLTAVTGATIADGEATGTILNDDIPRVSVNDVSVIEGDTRTKTLTFVVTREAVSSSSSVRYATADGTASAGSDYVARPPTPLGFGSGETSKTVTVTVNGDTSPETDEAFTLNLSSALGAAITDGSGTGTIRNDDVPQLSVEDVSAPEGDTTFTPLRFTIERTGVGVESSVDYEVVGGTASPGADYAAVITRTTLNFAPNQTTATATVSITGDTLPEPDETLSLKLLNPVGARIVKGVAVGTIEDNDTVPQCTLEVTDASLVEGQAENRLMTFGVLRGGDMLRKCSVDYATADSSATATADYLALRKTTLGFAPNERLRTVPVTIVADTVIEPDEVFSLKLFNPVEAVIRDGIGQGTIVNDDFDATFSAIDGSDPEGNVGSPLLVFAVTREGSSGPASVVYATSNGSATAGSDYVAVGPTTLEFAEGQNIRQVTIALIPDTVLEPDETLTINLSSPVGATIQDGSATGTIENDDNPPLAASLSINDVSVDEGTGAPIAGIGPGGDAIFTITRAGDLSGSSSVIVSTADGSARSTAGGSDNDTADFGVLTPISVAFAPNQTVATVTVPVVGDAFVEPNETFFMNLSEATGATVADGQGQATIINDDQHTYKIAGGNRSFVEGDAGTTPVQFTVFRPTFGNVGASVAYTISDGSATAGSDYVAAPSGTLLFNLDDHVERIDITIRGDTSAEPDETFLLTLSAPENGVIIDGSATATIVNDDTTLAIDDVSIQEGAKDETATLTFTVSRSGGVSGAASVTYATANVSAFAGSDFVGIVPTPLSFSPGETTKRILVTIVGDGDFEATETFGVNLSAPVGATIADNHGVGTIINDD